MENKKDSCDKCNYFFSIQTINKECKMCFSLDSYFECISKHEEYKQIYKDVKYNLTHESFNRVGFFIDENYKLNKELEELKKQLKDFKFKIGIKLLQEEHEEMTNKINELSKKSKQQEKTLDLCSINEKYLQSNIRKLNRKIKSYDLEDYSSDTN